MRLIALAATLLAAAAGVAGVAIPVASSSSPPLHEHPAIQYIRTAPNDRIARLSHAVVPGSSIQRDARTGYLRPLLEALGLSVESQLLVFSKTGVQRQFTSPRTPRAIFFDESIAIGYVPGAPSLEIAAHDPQQGVIFYTVDQAAPTFSPARQTTCLSCHVSDSTDGVPGMIVRSNAVGDDGTVLPRGASVTVTHATPHALRWGGWFVTSGGAPPPYTQTEHAGNVTVSPGGYTSNRAFLDWFNGSPETLGYLSALSETAALLAFDHQMHAINLLTRVNWDARIVEAGGRAVATDAKVRSLINELADYLLFVREAHFSVPNYPRPAFAAQLLSRFPRDEDGRSLAQLDLITRLLRYPCSYMVYSEAFDSLPSSARQAVYARMIEVIQGRVKNSPYEHPEADRRAVIDILAATKREFPR